MSVTACFFFFFFAQEIGGFVHFKFVAGILFS